MQNIYYRFGQWPIGYAIERAVVLFVIVCFALMVTACSTAPTKEAEQPLSVHDANAARAMALQKIGESATDGETKRLAIFAVMSLGNGQAAAAPAPVVVGNRSVGDAIFGFLDRTFERALNVAPAYLAYRGQVRAAQTTENVAAINRDVALNQSNNFLALGLGGVAGTQNVGIAGVNALASVAGKPSTAVTVTGNSGPVNVGTGTQTNSSNNPVNPAPVVCTFGTATAAGTCSRGP